MMCTIIRSKRKTISLSITRQLEVVIKVPTKMPKKDIDAFIEKHTSWIEKHKLEIQNENEFRTKNALSSEQIADLKALAKQELPERVRIFSDLMQVVPSNIKITSATTRWGSCSGKNSICFPYRLMLLPNPLIDYVVVHELAHIREKNHSKRFYDEVRKYLPDYKERVKLLKQITRKVAE